MMVQGGPVAAASCITAEYTASASGTSDPQPVGTIAGNYYAGIRLDDNYIATGFNLCGITFILTSTGTVTGYNYYASVWTDDGFENLGTQQGSNSVTVTGVNSWSDTSVKFTFAVPIALATSTKYIMVLSSGAAASDTNYISQKRGQTNAVAATGWGRYLVDKTIGNGSDTDVSYTLWK
jgi:hypothetical protein